ncbi:hypothetical protein [Dolichospermum phage Dfl-JY14]
MHTKTNAHGFTLFEMLVVLVIASFVAAIAFAQVRHKLNAESAATMIVAQAKEMVMIADAAQRFADANKASWPVNTLQTITVQQLIAGNLLSASFASRGGSVGATPIGETYRVLARKDAAGVARLVIADFGRPPVDALLRRSGYMPNALSVAGYKARVAAEISNTSREFAGSVAGLAPTFSTPPQPGTMTARGVLGTFTQDLTPYLQTIPALPVAVILKGWPEHQLPAGPGGPESNAPGFCNVAEGVAGSCFTSRFGNAVSAPCWAQSSFDAATLYREPTLPLGARNIVRVPICAGGMNIIATGVNGVALTAQTGTRTYTVSVPGCRDMWNVEHEPESVQISEIVQTINLNNGPVFETICGSSYAERNPNTCAVVVRSSMSDANRVIQTTPVSYNSINGTQTFNPLSAHTGNTRSTGGPNTRGHWFYCTDTAP